MEIKLNDDQKRSLQFIKSWYNGSSMYMVLDGRGGVGKSYLINHVLKELPNCTPILLAPTHEALKQLKDKTEGEYIFKTIHSALGISPIDDGKDIKFEHRELPKMWENFNLAIADEASMLPEWILQLLLSTGVKIIWCGHSSQLPPVDKKRGVFDKCISPVFTKGYPTTTLTIPQRNTGELWDFCNELDDLIYTTSRDIPNIFDITKADLREYVRSEQGKLDFLNGDTKIVLYTNYGVDTYNDRVRKVLFGKEAELHKYLPTDKIILTSPLTCIDGLERCSDSTIKKLRNAKDLDTLYSNTKATVISCTEVVVKLNISLHIQCYKIFVDCEEDEKYFYTPKHKDDWDNIGKFYEHLAWGCKNQKDKIRAFQERRFILSCFAELKHFYSATVHRLQGSTYNNIIVINSDIAKVANIIEQKKSRYTAVSRAKNNLYFYRGI
jgi:hypothetical protein